VSGVSVGEGRREQPGVESRLAKLALFLARRRNALRPWLASLPDVPTLKESGYDAVFFQWSGLFVPAGTPEPVMAKLRDAARVAAMDPKFVGALATVETPVQYLDAPDMQKFWAGDAKKLSEAVTRVGKLE